MRTRSKQVELGVAVGEVRRKKGMAEATSYVRRKKYGGLGPSEQKRLRVLVEENRILEMPPQPAWPAWSLKAASRRRCG